MVPAKHSYSQQLKQSELQTLPHSVSTNQNTLVCPLVVPRDKTEGESASFPWHCRGMCFARGFPGNPKNRRNHKEIQKKSNPEQALTTDPEEL